MKLKFIIKKYWWFLLLLIPFIGICIVNRFPTNDIWFLLNNGRYVVNNGIPHIEPFTIHVGLNYVMQQWLSSLVFYSIFNVFGKYGLLSFVLLFSLLLMILYYRICFIVTKNKIVSIITTIIVFYLGRGYIVFRPQLFTYIILLMEFLFLEKYTKSNNYKWLIPLPILSILLINFHASMWWLQFVFMLPFLCNCINIKGITIDKIRVLPLFIVAIFMFMFGFINPYGINAITYVFNSYNDSSIVTLVSEMAPLTLSDKNGIVLIFSLLGIIFFINYLKKLRLDIRYILFFVGTAIFAFMHYKTFTFYLLYGGIVVACAINQIKFKDINNKFINAFIKGVCISLPICLVFSSIITLEVLYKNYKFTSYSITKTTNYILDNYDKNMVKLFVDYDDGGYAEYMGLKSYIDPRAEVFCKSLNKKENIISEAIRLEKMTNDEYKKFLEKYDFTHVIIPVALQRFDKYMSSNEDYILEYVEHYEETEKTLIFNKLYVKKSISVEHLKNVQSN